MTLLSAVTDDEGPLFVRHRDANDIGHYSSTHDDEGFSMLSSSRRESSSSRRGGQRSLRNDDDERQPREEETPNQIILRNVVVLTLGTVLTAVLYDACTARRLPAAVTRFCDGWLSDHPGRGVLAVVFVYALGTVCFVPGSVLTVGVGYAFGRAFAPHAGTGVAVASTAVFVGATLGSLACFYLGRTLFRSAVLRLAADVPLFHALDRALRGNRGLQIMVLLRLSPLVPYNALDYVSGLTSISVRHYSLALVGILPGTIAFCYIGATASSFAAGTETASSNHAFRRVVLFLGLAFALAGAGLGSYYAKQELDKILREQQEDEEEEEEDQQRQQNRQELMQVQDSQEADDAENDTVNDKRGETAAGFPSLTMSGGGGGVLT